MNIFKSLFKSKPQRKTVNRVRNTDSGMFARKVKIGGMYQGEFYMPSKVGFKAMGR